MRQTTSLVAAACTPCTVASVTGLMWSAAAVVLTAVAALLWWQAARHRPPRRRGRHAAGRHEWLSAQHDVELAQSPLTGALPARHDKPGSVPTAGVHTRVLTTASAPVLTPLPHSPNSATVPSAMLPPQSGPSDCDLAQMLEQEWEAANADALAAHGTVGGPSALAGLLMAGLVGRRTGDPRAEQWLFDAFVRGGDPTEDAFVRATVPQQSLDLHLENWPVQLELPCTRVGLGLSVAGACLRERDAARAASVLLLLPATGLVRLCRAVAGLEADWLTLTFQQTAQGAPGSVWDAPLRVVRAVATARDNPGEAAAQLEGVIEGLSMRPGPMVSAGAWLDRAQFERAHARSRSGDVDGAWKDLVELANRPVPYPGAADLLRTM